MRQKSAARRGDSDQIKNNQFMEHDKKKKKMSGNKERKKSCDVSFACDSFCSPYYLHDRESAVRRKVAEMTSDNDAQRFNLYARSNQNVCVFVGVYLPLGVCRRNAYRGVVFVLFAVHFEREFEKE